MKVHLEAVHGMTNTVTDLGVHSNRAAITDTMELYISELVKVHGQSTEPTPGISSEVGITYTNVGFADGHIMHFRETPAKDETSAPVASFRSAWGSKAAQGELSLRPLTSTEILTQAMPKPAWSDSDHSQMARVAAGCTYNSIPVAMPLSQHLSEIGRNGKMSVAHSEVWIRQSIRDVEPLIRLSRYGSEDGPLIRVPGSIYTLSLEEAVELARTLLLAVEVAREDEAGR